jgi:hypothetical protein
MRPIALIGALVLSALLTPGPTDAQWGKVPTITIAASAQDSRVPLALEAVAFWNRQFAELGTPFRLGDVTQTTNTLPADYLTRLSAAVLNREPPPEVPERVRQMPGDLILALSDGDFISFARRLPSGARVVVGIRSAQLPPLSLSTSPSQTWAGLPHDPVAAVDPSGSRLVKNATWLSWQ